MRKGLTLGVDVLLAVAAIASLGMVLERQGLWIISDLWRRPYFEVGKHLPITGLANWGLARHNVVLLVSTRCQACAASAPFYRSLFRQVRDLNTRVVVFCAEGQDAGKRYLTDLGLGGLAEGRLEVFALRFSQGRRVRFPSLLLLDSEGKVLSAWVGRLEPAQEETILAKLRGT